MDQTTNNRRNPQACDESYTTSTCSSDMTLPRIESLGLDKPGFEPNFQSSDILAGTVGEALLLLFTVVAFLAWRVLFVLPMRQPLYKGAVEY